MSDIPARKMPKKTPEKVKPEKSASPGLLDQILGMFKKKPAEPAPRRPRQHDQSIPPP